MDATFSRSLRPRRTTLVTGSGHPKITSLRAQREHLDLGGLLKPGYFADITIFDPATIIDHDNSAKSEQLSDGIDYTIVNDQVEYDHGKLTGATAGQVLRGRG